MVSEPLSSAVEQILRARAAELAASPTSDVDEPVELLVFSSGTLRLAVTTDRVREILPPGPIAQLPSGPSALQALRAIRGGVVAVVDPARMLDAGSATALPSDRFVVVLEDGASPLGLFADTIDGVVSERRLRPASPSPLIRALTSDGAAVLDVEELLHHPRTTTAEPDHATT